MLDFQLEKYRDFKGYIDEYLNDEIPKQEILNILDSLRIVYEHRHTSLFKNLERDPELCREHDSWISKLRTATSYFEEAREACEEAIMDDTLEDLDEALEVFKDGNRLLLEAALELEEYFERDSFSGSM